MTDLDHADGVSAHEAREAHAVGPGPFDAERLHDAEGARPRHELHVAGAVCRRTAGGESGAKGIE